jgi:hypothetical protein
MSSEANVIDPPAWLTCHSIDKPFFAKKGLFYCIDNQTDGAPAKPRDCGLQRFKIRTEGQSVSDESIIDRFLRWVTKSLGPSRYRRNPAAESVIIEVVIHNRPALKGLATFGNGKQHEVYRFVERNPPGEFVELTFLEEAGRPSKLDLKAYVVLQCEEHGHTWEINVLG